MRLATGLFSTAASIALLTALITCANAGTFTPFLHMQVASGDPLESVFMNPLFDDTEWNTGQAAFGSGGGCPLDGTVHTAWSVDTDMLLRRQFQADPSIPVTIHVAIDNDVMVWVNGTLIFSATHEGCASLDDFNPGVPPAILAPGMNQLAVLAVDRGVISFVDVRLEGDQPTPVSSRTWGSLKSLYR